jgi:predicted transcriptional regulator
LAAKTPKKAKPLSITIPAGLKDKLEGLAAADDRSVAYIVREALVQYVDRESKKVAA